MAALKARGLTVRMLTGDGPAVAGAIAAELDGFDASATPADKAALMRPDPALVGAALDIVERTVAKVRQNLFWAVAYNVIGLPLAAMGFLTPAVAGAAMAASSVSVVTNSLLLKRWRAG